MTTRQSLQPVRVLNLRRRQKLSNRGTSFPDAEVASMVCPPSNASSLHSPQCRSVDSVVNSISRVEENTECRVAQTFRPTELTPIWSPYRFHFEYGIFHQTNDRSKRSGCLGESGNRIKGFGMALFQRILVGVDLHQGDRVAARELGLESRAAIEEAIALCTHSGGSVTFCSALNVSPQTATLIAQDHLNLLKTVEDVAADMLEAVVAEAKSRGVSAEKVIRLGPPEEQLAKVAIEGKYDLVIVGTRSRNKATRMLFGSTAQRLIQNAPCAVWIVKPEEMREILEIAVATDLSEAGRPALNAAVEVARALSARLFVVHAVDMGELSALLMAGVNTHEIASVRTRLLEDAQTGLQNQLAATDYRTLQHGVKVEVVEGSADDAIPKFVTENEVDILVMGTHGRSGLTRLLLGNTAERILPNVHCSVITVKPDGFVSPVA